MIRELLNRLKNLRKLSPEEPPFWENAERDERDNAATTPPPGELIQLVSLSLVEAYPPSFLVSLETGLRRLYPDRASIRASQDPFDWINFRRGDFRSRGWINVGVVVRNSNQFPFGPDKLVDSDLPPSVASATVSLAQTSSNLILANITFRFTDESAGLLQADLIKVYETTASKLAKDRTAIHTVENTKREAVVSTEQRLTNDCTSWIRRAVPGLFSSIEASSGFPSIALKILDSAEPFPDPPGVGRPGYLDILGLGCAFPVWTSDDLKGLKLVRAGGSLGNPHLVVACKREGLLEGENLDSYGGRDNHGIANRLSYDIEPMVRVLALDAVLNVFAKKVNSQKDQLSDVRLNKRNSVKEVHRIQQEIAGSSAEIKSMSTELGEESSANRYLLNEVPQFNPTNNHMQNEPHLFEGMRLSIVYFAPRVEGAALDLITNMSTTASLLASEKQEQLQGKILMFAGATFLATTVAVAIALWSVIKS